MPYIRENGVVRKKAKGLLSLALTILLLGGAFSAKAQGPLYREYSDTNPLLVSKIAGAANGDALTVFRSVGIEAAGDSTVASIVQRTTSSGAVVWSKRFPGLSIAEVAEAKNGDLLLSGSEWHTNRNGGEATPFLLRTGNDAAFIWRLDAPAGYDALPSYLNRDQRIAETSTGKIYFHYAENPAAGNDHILYYVQATGTPVWSRRLRYPSGFTFTDAVSTFENNFLSCGYYNAGANLNSFLVNIDSTTALKFVQTVSGTGSVVFNQILKDGVRRQYYFCGDFAANGLQTMVAKSGADLQASATLPAVVAFSDVYKCLPAGRIYGLDGSGNVQALSVNPSPLPLRKVTDGTGAHLQVPAWIIDPSLRVAGRRRYVLPLATGASSLLTSARQLSFINGRTTAVLQMARPAASTVWAMGLDTASTACVSTPETFGFRNVNLQLAAVRTNAVLPGVLMIASTTLDGANYLLTRRDTCVAPRKPKSQFQIVRPGATLCNGFAAAFLETSFGEPQSWEWIFPPEADLSNADQTCFPDVYNVVFGQPGTFAVKLVTTNGQGNDTAVQYITVLAAPLAPNLGPDVTLCPGDSLKLGYGNGTGVTHRFFRIGGGLSTTADTVVIKTAGTYVCAVQSVCGTVSDTVVVQQASKPKADFTAQAACGSLSVSFTDASQTGGSPALSYRWHFYTKSGAVLDSSQQQNPAYAFPVYDTVRVRLIVTGLLACTASDTIQKIVVLKPAPAAAFRFAETCGSVNVSFVANTGTGFTDYTWDFGDGATGNGASVQHLYATAGSYNVGLVVGAANGCNSDTARQRITLRQKPVADFSYRNDACESQPFTLTDSSTATGSSIGAHYWYQPSTGQSYNTAVIRPVTAAGPVAFLHSVTSAQGCASDTVSKTILVESIPTARFSVADVCEGTGITLSQTDTIAVGAITRYQWTVSNGFTSAQASPSLTLPAGSYTVTHIAESRNGCVSIPLSRPLQIFEMPEPSFTFGPACLGKPVTFVNTTPAATGFGWQWRINNAVVSTAAGPVYTFAQAGTYAVALQATSRNGCTDSVLKTVSVEDFRLRLTATANPVVAGIPVTVSSGAAVPYNVIYWSPAAAFSQQSAKGQRFVPDSTLLIDVAARSAAGCTDTASLLLQVVPPNDIYVPSAFTPNGDGRNDVLYVIGKDVAGLDFKVYNRWGETVFASRDKSAGWDGRVNGRLQPSGTYVYTLRAKKANGQTVDKKGTVSIIR